MGPCYNDTRLYSAAEACGGNGADELITEI